VEDLAGELEVVALLVDAPAPVPVDVDAVLHVGDQALGRGGRVGAGLQRDVRHPLDGEGPEAVRIGAAVRAALAPDQRRLAEGRLVVAEDAVLHDGELPACRLHAVVVPGHRGEAAVGAAVGEQVHDPAPVLQLVEPVGCAEGGAREIRLVAERPVQLRGMAHGLVDGEPEIAGRDDEIAGARLHRRSRHLLPRLLHGQRRLSGGVPAREMLPSCGAGRAHAVARGESARFPVYQSDAEGGVDARADLLHPRAEAVRQPLPLAHCRDVRMAVGRALAESGAVDREESVHLLLQRNGEGVRLDRHLPPAPVRGQSFDLDRSEPPARLALRDRDGRVHQREQAAFVDLACGGEAPRAIDQHPHRGPERRRGVDTLHHLLADVERLVLQLHQVEVGERGPELRRPAQHRVGQRREAIRKRRRALRSREPARGEQAQARRRSTLEPVASLHGREANRVRSLGQEGRVPGKSASR